MSLFIGFGKRKSLYSTSVTRGNDVRFRLMRLEPGHWKQPLCCTLHVLPLAGAPPYKALSYAWDNGTESTNEESFCVECNGIAVPVSYNLHAALRRLRDVETPIHVWVDAICINQKDDRERTHQVQLMRDIYRKSHEVAIWLGEGTKYDDLGEDLVLQPPETTGARPSLNWKGDMSDKALWDTFRQRQETRQGTLDLGTRDIFGAFCILWLLSIGVTASEIMHLRHIAQSTTILNGLDAIREQPWWRRVWVVQETVVSSNAAVYYGRISAPWKMIAGAAARYHAERLATGIESVYPYLRSLSQFSRIVREIEGVRLTWRHQYKLVAFLPLLHQFRSRSATDPRDKVYALLGIVQQWEGPGRLIPDYEVDVEKVFWKTTVTFIKNLKSLDVLAGTPTQRLASEIGSSRPSWITDWSFSPENNDKSRIFGSLRLYNASKSIPPRPVRTHGQTILELYGFGFDQVEHVSQEVLPLGLADDGDTNQWRKVVSDWESLLEKHYEQRSSYAGGGEVADAFWRTLCGDCEYVRSESSAGLCRAQDTLELGYHQWRSADIRRRRMTSIVGGYWQESGVGEQTLVSTDTNAERKNAFHYALAFSACGRRFFRTKGGYIGLGPVNMVEGDIIFIVAGSRVPLVLRSSPKPAACNQAATETMLISGTERTFVAAGIEAKGMAPREGRGTCNDTHTHCFALVGDVYLHGIMDGQAGSRLEQEAPGPIFLV